MRHFNRVSHCRLFRPPISPNKQEFKEMAQHDSSALVILHARPSDSSATRRRFFLSLETRTEFVAVHTADIPYQGGGNYSEDDARWP